MIRKYKGQAIATTLCLLLQLALGAVFYERIPDPLGGGKRWMLLGLPLILLAAHWLVLLIFSADPGNRGQNRKAVYLVFWTMPALSLLVGGATYQQALKGGMEAMSWITILFGLLFLLFGNLMPKIRPNRTLGIRLPWTMGHEENWNRTHRLAGKVWVAGGIALLLSLFLPRGWQAGALLIVLLLLVLIPSVYSFLLYRRHRRQGVAYVYFTSKRSKAATLAVAAVIVCAVAVLLLTGSVRYTYGDTALSIEASYWSDLTLPYDRIDRAEYRDACPAGTRTNGFGSFRLLLGAFHNDEFGDYTRYTYSGCDACVVLYLQSGEIVVVNGADAGSTRTIWQQIGDRLGT